MNISAAQKSICERVLNAFETGSADGDYANISIFNDGPHNIRQITYGRSQTTEYGKLQDLVARYVSAQGKFAAQLARYVNKIGQVALVNDGTFQALLKRAGKEDPVMRETQDRFFDERYFAPALKWAGDHGFTHALSLLVIYDSFIHSGGVLGFLRSRFNEAPPVSGGNEKKWIEQYVSVRHTWLENHSRPILRKTVYRTNCFKREIARGNWDLSQVPVNANGIKVSPAAGVSDEIVEIPQPTVPTPGEVPFVGKITSKKTGGAAIPGIESGEVAIESTSPPIVTRIDFEMELGVGDSLRVGNLVVLGEKRAVLLLAEATSGKRGSQGPGSLWSVSQGAIPPIDGLSVNTDEVEPESDSHTGPRFVIEPDWLHNATTGEKRGGFSIRGAAPADGTGGSIAFRDPGDFQQFRELMASAAAAGMERVPLKVIYTGEMVEMPKTVARKLEAVFSMKLAKSDNMLHGTFIVTDDAGNELYSARATSGKRGFQHPAEFWTPKKGVVPPIKDDRFIETSVWATDGSMGRRYRILPEKVSSPDGSKSRSAFRVHIDSNAPGSEGCIVFPSQADFDRLVGLLAALKQKGIEKLPLNLNYT